MRTDWYHIEDDETVGPTTLEDIAGRISQTGQSRQVWTEGMTDWADATAVPALSQLLRTETPRRFARSSDRADSTEPVDPQKATLSRRLWRELIEYLSISAYLYICFGSLIFYKATILRSDGIESAVLGIAIVKALILGKFTMVLHALKIGERRGGAGILLADILKKSLLFVLFLIALTVIEEVVVGYFHGRTSQEVLGEMAGGSLQEAVAVSILMLLILIPYFTFRGIAERLGDGILWKTLIERSRSR
jgi:GYF domain 2